MPAPGDQYRPQAAAANPYEEQAPRISEFTAAEIATLASRLDKQLGPEYISSRPGAGGQKVHYLAAEKVINLANEVFGFNGWSSQIKNVQVDFCDEHQTTGRIDVGLSIIVRVTLKDGTFHEDLGYGHIENCKGKAAAFEKARKEAATDALKRTLRTFGNVLGNCLYDKEYLSRVTKVKAQPTSKWDPDNLYRHQEFAPPKKENEQMLQLDAHPAMLPPDRALQPGHSRSSVGHNIEDEFGGDLFDEVELSESHTDGVALANPGPPQSNTVQDFRRVPQAGSVQPRPQPQQYQQTNQQRPVVPPRNGHVGNNMQPPNQLPRVPSNPHMNNGVRPHPSRSTTPNTNMNQPPPLPAGHEPPVGFITGRCAEALTGDKPPPQSLATLQRFNPAAESPSIRKTSGVDHASSKPISREMLTGGASADAQPIPPPAGVPPSPAPVPHQQGQTTPRNFVNPAADANRRIGMPQSPMANRTSYKPPGPAAGAVAGVKRPAPRAETPGDRAPLADVSNVAAVGAPVSGPEGKRTKLGEA